MLWLCLCVCSCSFVNKEHSVVYCCMFLSCVSKCTFSNTAVTYCLLASQNLFFQTAVDFSLYLIIFWMKCYVLKLKLLKFKAFCSVNSVSLSLQLLMCDSCLSCWSLDPEMGPIGCPEMVVRNYQYSHCVITQKSTVLIYSSWYLKGLLFYLRDEGILKQHIISEALILLCLPDSLLTSQNTDSTLL
jgi:hypothetical protein